MSRSRKILIVGWFAFPFGSAGASRVRHIAKGLIQCGHDVEVLTTARIEVRPVDVQDDGSLVFEKIRYRSANQCPPVSGRTRGFVRAFRLLKAVLWTWHVLYKKFASRDCNALYLYGRNFYFFFPVLFLARWMRVPVFFEINEWTPSTNFQFGKLNPFFWNDWLGRQLPKWGGAGVIAITTFIQEQYRSSGTPVFVMPSIKEFKEGTPARITSAEVSPYFVVVYAGSCKKSDGFDELLTAIEDLATNDDLIRLEILGNDGTKGAAITHRKRCEDSPLLKKCVRFNGYLSEVEYATMLSKADCLVVPRPDSQAVRAAFPTRIPEFLDSGNAVVTSNVPDIPLYLEPGLHAEIYDAGIPNSLKGAIIKLRSDSARKMAIGRRGRERGLECFCYKINTYKLGQFMIENGNLA